MQDGVGLDLADVVAHLREGLQIIGPEMTYLYVNQLVGRRMTDAYPGMDRRPWPDPHPRPLRGHLRQ